MKSSLKPGSVKRVNVVVAESGRSGEVGFSRQSPLRGRVRNITLPIEVIRACIVARGQVDEILPDGSTVRLTLSNYNKVNTTKKPQNQKTKNTFQTMKTQNGRIIAPVQEEKKIVSDTRGENNEYRKFTQGKTYIKPPVNDPFGDVNGSSSESNSDDEKKQKNLEQETINMASPIQGLVNDPFN